MNYLIMGFSSIGFLIIVDLVLAVSLHIKEGNFEYKKLFNFVKTNVLPYMVLFGFFAALPLALPYIKIDPAVLGFFEGLDKTVFGLIILKLIGSISANAKLLNIEINK